MAALRNAVSPDFTYSRSYLSLLSASGCMAGIICCISPSFWPILKKALNGKQLRWKRGVKALQVYISGPLTIGTRVTRTFSELEEGRDCYDLEKCSDSETDTVEGEGRSAQEVVIGSTGRFPHSNDEVNMGAIAWVDFCPSHKNELTLRQGQLVWIRERRRPDFLLAEDLLTQKTGLVPQRCVRLFHRGARSEMVHRVQWHSVHCGTRPSNCSCPYWMRTVPKSPLPIWDVNMLHICTYGRNVLC